MSDEFADEVGPLEEIEECENCEDKRMASEMRRTEDDVLLCPECWTACCEDEQKFGLGSQPEKERPDDIDD